MNPVPPLVTGHSARRRRGGFALLITITLLAFLVLLLVSLASLTRVETQVAANNQSLAQARQNALLGLNIALGRLQALAGPDQRVTATADLINGRNDKKQHWTGVWNADASAASYGKNIGWLASGTPDGEDLDVSGDLSAVTDGKLVPLLGEETVGATTASDQVTVSTQPIKSSGIPGLSGAQTIGQFAWWVGDEGVKANVALTDPWAGSADAAQRRYAFVNLQRSGVELVQADASHLLDTAYPANTDAVSRLLAMKQFPLLATTGSAAADLLAAATRNRYHDLTAVSSSVLADVAKGGLKKDLTNWLAYGAPTSALEQDATPIVTTSENTSPGMPAWGLLRSYAGARSDGPALAPLEQTRTQTGLAPVITFFRLGLNISATPGQPMQIHLFPVLVLWNPHNVPLAPTTYQVAWRISNSRTLKFTPVATSATPTTLALGGSGNFLVFDVKLTADMPPGQSLVFRVQDDAGANPAYTGLGSVTLVNKAEDGTSAVIAGNTYTATDLADGLSWSVSNTAGDTMLLVLRQPTAAAPQGAGQIPGEYQAVNGLGFANFAGSGATVTSLADLAGPVIAPRFSCLMYARMAGTTSGNSFRWIANQNYLARFSPRPAADGSSHSIFFSSITSLAGPTGALSFADGDLRASAGATITVPSGAAATDLVLREILPTNAVLTSLAQLQSANLSLLSQYPFYAVGNSLASPYIALGDTAAAVTSVAGYTAFHDLSYLLNRDLWDRYFFSTVPTSLTAADLASPGYHLPNARHVFTPAATIALLNGKPAFDTAASCMRLRGGFNVNSTSVQAWRALLAGHCDLEVSGSFRHPFSRFVAPSGTLNAALEGHRLLSDDQIETLAEKIRDEVLARGPFLSLADFVNRRLVVRGHDTTDAQRYKGALQAAIDTADTEAAAPVINTDAAFQGNNAGTVPTSGVYQEQFQGGATKQSPVSSRLAFAPGYLTQADLLTAIGPALTARSDTFVIRAYGEAVNPVTGATEGKAWCEAVVQRSTRYVDDSLDPWTAPPAGSDSARFGRRFQIVSFRWLAPLP